MARPNLFPSTQKIKSVPAPIGGLNASDNIAQMPPTDAVVLVNWVPDVLGVRCRKGYREWATNFPSGLQVSSIFGYISSSTVFPGGAFISDPTAMPGTLFAATDAGIYDITSRTSSPTLSQALSGLENAGWFSTVQMVTAGGQFLLACSETDGYFTFDGTSWVKRTSGVGAGQINGVDPANLVFTATFKRRAWFVERNSTKAWYLPVDSIAGIASAFDFGPQFKRGGHLAYLANWTIDAGEGIDDFLVAVSSNGDVAIYKGTDPAGAATFSLVGTWFVGQIPVGRRAFVQYGGDLVLFSAEGVYPVSMITRGGAEFLSASGREYTSKIRPLIGGDLRDSFTSRGWQAYVHPSERLMVVNVPNYGSVRNKQFAMSTSVNQWTQFDGIPIISIGGTAGYAFGGSRDGKVYLLFNGYFDNVLFGASTGQGIAGAIVPAYSYFDQPGQTAHFLMVRPTFLSVDTPNYLVGVSVNFSATQPTGAPTFNVSSSSTWDTSLWNSAIWGGAQKVFADWVSVGAIGFAGAASLSTVCVGDTTLTSIEYMYASGGPL